jgi:hypothetical protein
MRKKAKKPYNKPRIGEVKITPEEAVLTLCKQNTAGQAKQPTNYACKNQCLSAQGS